MNKLRPWQSAPAARLLEILRHSNAVDMSSTGVGKTAHAAHVIAELKLPTLVIAPKIAATSWRRMLEHFETSASITNWEALTMGNVPFGKWEKAAERGKFFFVCENCQCKYHAEEKPDRCYATAGGVHCFSKKPLKQKRGRWIWSPQVKFIVADEVHRAGAIKSLNAELIIGARRQNLKFLGCSATLAISPLGMRSVGYALGLFENPDVGFYLWSRRHGCGRIPALPGWRWLAGAERQREIMESINSDLIPARGIRLTTDSIPNFPTRNVSVELYDLDKPDELNKIYSEMASALAALSERTAQNSSGESPLTAQLRARQRAEILKIPIAVELCNDALAKGFAVAIFVSFSATIAELRTRLNCDCFIAGTQQCDERQKCLDDFQSDKSQVIVVNSKAGGVSCSLHDLCDRPRLGIIFPSFSAVEYLQVLGRLHRDGALSSATYKTILVAGTVEEKIKKALDNKLTNIESLCDGDLIPT